MSSPSVLNVSKSQQTANHVHILKRRALYIYVLIHMLDGVDIHEHSKDDISRTKYRRLLKFYITWSIKITSHGTK